MTNAPWRRLADGLWGGACISGALPSTEDIFRTAPWIQTYYSSPKPKVTDAPMFHLLLKAPNKYLPDLTQWVMTEHPAWQIMLLENFKLCIFDADSGADVGWVRKTPPPMNHVISLRNRGHFDYARIWGAKEVPLLTAKPAHLADAFNGFLEDTYLCWQHAAGKPKSSLYRGTDLMFSNAEQMQIHVNTDISTSPSHMFRQKV